MDKMENKKALSPLGMYFQGTRAKNSRVTTLICLSLTTADLIKFG